MSTSENTASDAAAGESHLTGPEHYRKGELFLALAASDVSENWPVRTGERKADVIAMAHAHFAAALVAATIHSGAQYLMDGDGRPAGTRIMLEPDGSDWGVTLS